MPKLVCDLNNQTKS